MRNLHSPVQAFDPVWVQTHLPDGVDGVMKFTLVWRGKLPSSGNKPKPDDVARIRADLSPQFEYTMGHPRCAPSSQGAGVYRQPWAYKHIHSSGWPYAEAACRMASWVHDRPLRVDACERSQVQAAGSKVARPELPHREFYSSVKMIQAPSSLRGETSTGA